MAEDPAHKAKRYRAFAKELRGRAYIWQDDHTPAAFVALADNYDRMANCLVPGTKSMAPTQVLPEPLS